MVDNRLHQTDGMYVFIDVTGSVTRAFTRAVTLPVSLSCYLFAFRSE